MDVPGPRPPSDDAEARRPVPRFPDPPSPVEAPPVRPDVPGSPASVSPGVSPATRIVAFLVVLSLTVAALGGGLLAIERLTRPAPDPGRHRFLAFRLDGTPLRWNACDTIHYVVNAARAPEGSVADVHEAVRQIAEATGVAFEYDGLSDEVPVRDRDPVQPDRYGPRWAPVLIAWVAPRDTDIPFERDGHTAAAVASPLRPVTGEEVFVSGYVVMNVEDPNPPGFGSPGAQGPVLLHEIGHVMGLGHVEGRGEIMEPTGGGVTELGPGDLEGLRRVGRNAGCLVTPPVPR